MRKFELEYYDGCDYSTTINGKELVELSKEEIRDTLIPILKQYLTEDTDLSVLQSLFETVLMDNGAYEDLGYCETCGSYNSSYTMTTEIE